MSLFETSGRIDIRGVELLRDALDRSAQEALVDDLRRVAGVAPFYHPETRRGQKFSVRMTSAGAVGWISDRKGYRYQPHHPSGGGWPSIPPQLRELWCAILPEAATPDTCLVNYYGEGARMGMHQDKDEADLSQPVLSVSLGDEALFRVGNIERGGRTESVWLRSGDVAVIGGAARLVHHGIDRIRFGSSDLLPQGGRINVTMRVAGSGPGAAA
ncbi:alpha-ketoglutarate-dependent dioxygenase AlkB [Palleronia sp.]|uniref:alpha-ketoglutarate-dependent dioxygenase AlkB n=1 Tax=Palleronia sp. TaxID=1940284 RepID=UPI0035C7FAF9